jgi:hypothetical protein
VLRQAELLAASRAADLARRPTDRATLRRWLDEVPDSRLLEAAWLLDVLRIDAAEATAKGRDSDTAAEHQGLETPCDRWRGLLAQLVAQAPPSWYDSPTRSALVVLALTRAVRRAFEVPLVETDRPQASAR